MSLDSLHRRDFLCTAAAGAGAAFLSSVTPASARAMALGSEGVTFRPEIEPVVRWIEATDRDKIIDVAIERLRAGLSYRDLLAGLFLAGIRNIKPRPVGFKFHAVMVINSAHLLGQTAPVADRLLPLFWALDTFKNSQQQDVREGDWTLGKPDLARLPKPSAAARELETALNAWDVDAADAAVTALCRSAGAAEVMAPLWRAGLRDQRNIGHKAIFTAQCWRTLQAIGWEHAEPVLRSLVFGVLDLQGDSHKAPAGPYEANLENAKKIRPDWQVGKDDPGGTKSLLEAIRTGSAEEASAMVVKLLNDGVSPDSLWDGVVLAGAERLMRSPGILSIHAVTSSNALHFAYNAVGDETTRKLALLQAAGWGPMFRPRDGGNSALNIESIPAAEKPQSRSDAIADIFASIATSRDQAARKTMGYLAGGGSFDELFDSARRLVFTRGRDSHDYKYAAAAWEEHQLASDRRLREPLAAAMMFNLPSSSAPENAVVKRARDAAEKTLGPGG